MHLILIIVPAVKFTDYAENVLILDDVLFSHRRAL